MYRYADFWEVFGLTPLTIWDLPFTEFIEMCYLVDRIHATQEKQARDNGS